MTREDITRMADEADLWADQELQCIGEYHPDWHEVRDIRFAALVAAYVRETEFKPDWNKYQQGLADGAAAEREEILAYAKSEAFNRMHGERSPYAYELVNYIRARGQA